MNTTARISAACLALSALVSAQGITYVDAQLGSNTIDVTTGSTTSWGTTVNNGTDNLWAQRTTGPGVPAAGGDSWQATHNEDAPLLLTTVGGLNPGQEYTVYLYFIGKVCSHWPIRAGTDPMRLYDLDDRDADPVDPAGNVTVAPSCTDFRFRAFLGFATANAGGAIGVFIDDYTQAMSPPADRVVYDGIGVEPTLRAGVLRYGTGCPGSSGSAPVYAGAGLPTIGNGSFGMDLAGGPAGALAMTVFSFDLSPTTFGACIIEPQLPAAATVISLDPSGAGSVAVPIPNNPMLAGLAAYSTALVIDPGGTLLGQASASATVEIYIGS